MITYPGAMEELTAADVTDEALSAARHLHVSSVFLQKKLKPDIVSLFRRAKQLGMSTSLDPQWDPDERWDIDLAALLPYVDIFLPNITELSCLTGRDDIASGIGALKGYARIVAVKDGDKGAYIWDGDRLLHQLPFLNRQVIDCIGAGDSFNAGFIKKYLEHAPAEECLEFAVLAGAVNTTCAGGTGAFRDYEAFRSVARATFNYEL
jgi:sugar/nucleoside kinase (ribokinase family)